VFSYYVERAAPAAWTGLFRGTATIAFFLKYLDREDYGQAFTAFRHENDGASPAARRHPADVALFGRLIGPVAETYTAPLFKLEAATLVDEAKVRELIDGIRQQGERDGDTVLGMLRRVTAGWMELSKQKFQVPMVRGPRAAQQAAVLCCADRLAGFADPRRRATHRSSPCCSAASGRAAVWRATRSSRASSAPSSRAWARARASR
jgi:hypothetical protein